MIIIGIITVAVAIIYLFRMLLLIISWKNNPPFVIRQISEIPVSIIIPCRNEEKNIRHCINSILDQHYTGSLVEIIVVDDHSEDNTAVCAKEFERVKYFKLPEGERGKKAALNLGIRYASHELLITRDADTISNSDWLRTIVSAYLHSDADMIICPVRYIGKPSIMLALQKMELFALTIVTASTAFLGRPIMCNGANLCFSRRAFDEVGGFAGTETVASGDDVHLMNKVYARNKQGVIYLKNYNATVETIAASGFREAFEQRLRWARKNREISTLRNSLNAALIIICNVLFLFLGLLSAFYKELAAYFIFTAILKCFIDFLLLFLAASFQRQKKSVMAFPLMVILYPVFITVLSVAVFVSRPEWKGRTI